jgi:hypothetical protein
MLSMLLLFLKWLFCKISILQKKLFPIKIDSLDPSVLKKIGLFSSSELKEFILKGTQFEERDRIELISNALISYRTDGLEVNIPTLINEAITAGIYFSQEGEDIILERIFSKLDKGLFVDIGAHHPIRFSNTYGLYLKGWRGVNIDATPGSMEAFQRIRPLDINIELGISRLNGELDYFLFKEPALNTFNKNLAQQYIQNGEVLVGEQKVKTKPLREVLDVSLPSGVGIDLMTIDIEGHEMEALESNDWDRYRPRVIVIEDLHSRGPIALDATPTSFLLKLDYKIIARLFNSVILESN